MEKKRLEWIDMIRGGAILLVVLGHVTLTGAAPEWYNIMHRWVYSFHMPLFFAVSGFLFGYREWNIPTGKLIKKKLIALGIPYLIFDLTYVLLNVALQKMVQTNTVVTLREGLQFWRYPSAQYWFLYVLIIYFVVAAVLKNQRVLLAGAVALTSVFYAAGLVIWKDKIGFSFVYRAISYFFAFGGAALLGRHAAESGLKKPRHGASLLGAATAVYAFLFVVLYGMHLIPNGEVPLDGTVSNLRILRTTTLNWVMILLGSITFSAFVLLTGKIKVVGKAYLYLGKNTWYIYLIHSYFTAFMRLIAGKMGASVVVQLVLGMIGGVICPLLVAMVVRKIKPLYWCFYPASFGKKEK